MRKLFVALLVIAALVGTVWAGQFGWGPVVIVYEYEYKIPLLLGAPWRDTIEKPGLTWRIPLIETMETLDKRLQYLDAEAAEMLIGEGAIVVDYYAVWRISDPLPFQRTFAGSIDDANITIQRRLESQVAATVGRMSLEQLLARAVVFDELGEEVSRTLGEKGVEVVDVRINRTELPREAEEAAYAQMREQRRKISREHRAKGEREAREIRAKADREARTMLAQAQSQAEITRGEGDAEAAAIYATAYGKDPEFYAFLRSLEAYRATLGDGTTMVMAPDHEFFRYLDPSKPSTSGKGKSQPAAP
jgi:membrane protease subunit HflC